MLARTVSSFINRLVSASGSWSNSCEKEGVEKFPPEKVSESKGWSGTGGGGHPPWSQEGRSRHWTMETSRLADWPVLELIMRRESPGWADFIASETFASNCGEASEESGGEGGSSVVGMSETSDDCS